MRFGTGKRRRPRRGDREFTSFTRRQHATSEIPRRPHRWYRCTPVCCRRRTYNIIVAPAATPRRIVDHLNAAIGKVMSDRTFVDTLVKLGVDAMADSGPDKAAAMIRSELAQVDTDHPSARIGRRWADPRGLAAEANLRFPWPRHLATARQSGDSPRPGKRTERTQGFSPLPLFLSAHLRSLWRLNS
jgi:hypothetical protein